MLKQPQNFRGLKFLDKCPVITDNLPKIFQGLQIQNQTEELPALSVCIRAKKWGKNLLPRQGYRSFLELQNMVVVSKLKGVQIKFVQVLLTFFFFCAQHSYVYTPMITG